MMKKTALLMFVFGFGCLLACDTVHKVDWSNRPVSFKVVVKPVEGETLGSRQDPLKLPEKAGVKVLVSIDTYGAEEDAEYLEDLWVLLSVRPGKLTVASGDGRYGNHVLLKGGKVRDVPVTLKAVFGETRVWVEDVGYLPRTAAGRKALCSNEIDDNGNGLTDFPMDPGCYDADDDSEEPGSGAAGVSNPVWIANPTLAQVQGYADVTPYQGETITVDSGDMVVTRVTFDGMYVTDIADDMERGYNHMYVYNFNPPMSVPLCEMDEYEGGSCQGERPVKVRVCDRLTRLTGIVSEFYKFTELNFPAWELELWDPSKGPCMVPEPEVITGSDINSGLERLEAGLVRVVNAEIGRKENMVNCDLDGNGVVDFREYSTNQCSEECQCREACDGDPACTEYNQYLQYGQWPLNVGGVKLWVSSGESVPDFDPFNTELPKKIASVTGTLKNLSFLRPKGWILEPRCMDDIVISGAPKPSTEACVEPRTGKE
ncbi:MAG TPA: hypothetical protein PLC97_07740 [Myxococcota bacterium]|nr:hypothetical protein [Myxococcota bacterium]HQL57745.1 hypothetical protein [Myxococcota bacterium]